MSFSKHWYWYVVPILLLLPVFILRDYTTDNELRYLSIVEEALRDGSFFVFHNQGEVYADKPPLFFWFMMLFRDLTGGHYLWLYGVLSAVPAVVIFYVMNRWCFSVAKQAVAPMLALLTSVMFIASTVVMRMDMMMAMFIVLALWSFYKIYTGTGRPRERWLLPIYIFLAVFSKGAVGILMPLVAILAFLAVEGKFRTAGRYLGVRTWGVLLGLSAIWFAAVYAEGGSEYLNNLLFKQTVGRSINSFHHSAPWWYYLKAIWYMALPWSLFVAVMFFKAIKERVWDTRLRFFAVTTITTFVVMSCVSSKIDIYLLPIYPFFIYFAFMTLSKVKIDGWVKASIIVPASMMALVVVAFPFVGSMLPTMPSNVWLLYVGLALMCVGSVVAIVMVSRSRINDGVIALACGMLLCIFVGSFTVPDFNRYLGLREVAAKGAQIASDNNVTHYAVYRFRGENMDIYLGESIEKINDLKELDSLVNTKTDMVLFIRQNELRRWNELPSRLRATPCEQFGPYAIYVLKN